MYARRAPSGEIATSLILLALGIESRTAAAREEGAGSCARRDAQRNNGATIQKKNRAFILVSTLRSIQRVNNVQSTAHTTGQSGGSHIARRSSSGRNVTFLRVVHHHAIGVEAPAQRPNGSLHALDPATGPAVSISLVKKRNHFILKCAM